MICPDCGSIMSYEFYLSCDSWVYYCPVCKNEIIKKIEVY
jgi:hypothetical protein